MCENVSCSKAASEIQVIGDDVIVINLRSGCPVQRRCRIEAVVHIAARVVRTTRLRDEFRMLRQIAPSAESGGLQRLGIKCQPWIIFMTIYA